MGVKEKYTWQTDRLTQPIDKKGRAVEVGDLIKILHFIEVRRKRHWMYKVVCRIGDDHERSQAGWWYMYCPFDREVRPDKYSMCPVNAVGEFEIIAGFGPDKTISFEDRDKIQPEETEWWKKRICFHCDIKLEDDRSVVCEACK